MRSERFKALDARPVNQDGFVSEWPEVGLIAMDSPSDPKPSITLTNGLVTELDGKTRDQFDMIDIFIADYGIDLGLAEKAMAIDSLQVTHILCNISMPRTETILLTIAMTPVKLTEVISNMSVLEMMMAVTKPRTRKQPANQCHVINIADDPVQIAADSAEAVLRGFAEQETTTGMVRYAPSNMLSLLVGAQTGRPGILTQCAVEEATELQLGMRGLIAYAETVSVYGTEAVFMDGDDTPWSKAFLVSSYASHGLKMRFTSGTGSEVQMGCVEDKSMLYLKARCLFVTEAAGSQGTQNGSVSCIGVPAGAPDGIRAVLAENLIAIMLDLECASSNDQTFTHSDLRWVSRSLIQFVPSTDFICSGYSSTPNRDSMFAGSNWDTEDFGDWNIIQRDLRIDGGLTPALERDVIAVRRKAARALQAVFGELGLPVITDAEVEAATYAHNSDDMPECNVVGDLKAAEDIVNRKITGVDVAKALSRGGFEDVTQATLNLLEHRVAGDYLRISTIFDADFSVISAVNSPSDYHGLQTGYQIDDEQWNQIRTIRQAISSENI